MWVWQARGLLPCLVIVSPSFSLSLSLSLHICKYQSINLSLSLSISLYFCPPIFLSTSVSMYSFIYHLLPVYLSYAAPARLLHLIDLPSPSLHLRLEMESLNAIPVLGHLPNTTVAQRLLNPCSCFNSHIHNTYAWLRPEITSARIRMHLSETEERASMLL